MAEPTKATPTNVDEDDLVVPQDVAPSGHGGSGPAPVPHPLTPEANVDSAPGELTDPENNEVEVDDPSKANLDEQQGMAGRNRK